MFRDNIAPIGGFYFFGLSFGFFKAGHTVQGNIMARMTAAQAAVYVMEKEGVSVAFGVPGAAINPLYAALKKHGGIKHVLWRHVENTTQKTKDKTRTKTNNIGGCIGTSGPAGTDMITGLYS